MYSGSSALHSASGRGLLPLVRTLVRSGADSGLKNCHNDTPLMVARSRRVRTQGLAPDVHMPVGRVVSLGLQGNESAWKGGCEGKLSHEAREVPAHPRLDTWVERRDRGKERMNKGCNGLGVTFIFQQVIDILRGKASRAASGSQPEPSPDQSATNSPESSSRLSSNGESLQLGAFRSLEPAQLASPCPNPGVPPQACSPRQAPHPRCLPRRMLLASP